MYKNKTVFGGHYATQIILPNARLCPWGLQNGQHPLRKAEVGVPIGLVWAVPVAKRGDVRFRGDPRTTPVMNTGKWGKTKTPIPHRKQPCIKTKLRI